MEILVFVRKPVLVAAVGATVGVVADVFFSAACRDGAWSYRGALAPGGHLPHSHHQHLPWNGSSGEEGGPHSGLT